MKLQPTQTLSHYRLIEQIGEGGMGVVWKAIDTTLDREVAIKILPSAFSKNADRLARFEREAKLLASLNHPNIATIHGLHEDQGVRFLAMEFLAGEDLAQVLAWGPLSQDAAINIALHIAIALEEAHRNGVIHRDLKPANVKVTENKQVKVLDFGLARRQDETPAAGPDSDTVTQPGYIVGTAPYMSPEQVRGTSVDKRADIWALGCVLYEMLSGKRAFDGETESDRMAAVLKSEPDFDNLPTTTPTGLRRVLRRCLEKDPRRRWQDIGDVRLELDELAAGLEAEQESEAVVATPRTAGQIVARLAPWLVALTALAVAFTLWRMTSVMNLGPRTAVRMTLPPPADLNYHSRYATVAVPSPDGSRVVFVGVSPDDRRRLWLRALDELGARPLPGTDDAWQPFFSPDGSWIGFFADRKLKKVPVAGGPAETIVEIGGNPRGASWGTDGWIVVSPTQTSGLIRVDPDDGTIKSLTELNLELGESTHRWPQVLPKDRGVLFTARIEGTSFDRANIVVEPLDGGPRQVVVEGGAHARYINSGHLVYVRGGRLFAVPFDLRRRRTTGEPVRVIDGVTYSRRNGGTQFAVSENGTLVYRPGPALASESIPLWVDRNEGVTEPIIETRRDYNQPRLSADGSQLLVSIFDGRASTLWTLDVARATFTQITHRDSVGGRWVGPKAEFVVYAAGPPSQLSLFLARTDGLGQPQRLTEAEHRQEPCTVSPDGRYVVYQERRPKTGWDLMVLELDGSGTPVGKPRALLATLANEEQAHFSPDGKFLAYESDELDAIVQIYARAFPSMEDKRQLSQAGARQPRFSPTQNEVCFWSTGTQQFRAVQYTVKAGAIAPEPPVQILEKIQFSAAAGGNGGVIGDPSFFGYDIDSQRQRFVMLELEPTAAPEYEGSVVVVLDWFTELSRKR